MGISWNYSNRYCNNDYDDRSLSTSVCFVYFTHLIFIGFGVRDVLHSWLDPKRTNPDNYRDKAANKKTAFGLNFDLHQCQVRRGDLASLNLRFDFIESTI